MMCPPMVVYDPPGGAPASARRLLGFTQQLRKSRHDLFDHRPRSVDTQIKIQLISPLVPCIELIIFRPLPVDAEDMLFQFFVLHLFFLGGFLPAPCHLALHIRIDEHAERLIFS